VFLSVVKFQSFQASSHDVDFRKLSRYIENIRSVKTSFFSFADLCDTFNRSNCHPVNLQRINVPGLKLYNDRSMVASA